MDTTDKHNLTELTKAGQPATAVGVTGPLVKQLAREYNLMSTLEAGNTLNAAADLIERFGWIKGNLGSEEQGFCVLGAIYYVSTNRGGLAVQRATAKLRSFLDLDMDDSLATDWNDRCTKDEVIAALRAAAISPID